MALAMPSEPATQAALAAEGRTFNASRLASEDLIRVSLEKPYHSGVAWRSIETRLDTALGNHIEEEERKKALEKR